MRTGPAAAAAGFTGHYRPTMPTRVISVSSASSIALIDPGSRHISVLSHHDVRHFLVEVDAGNRLPEHRQMLHDNALMLLHALSLLSLDAERLMIEE